MACVSLILYVLPIFLIYSHHFVKCQNVTTTEQPPVLLPVMTEAGDRISQPTFVNMSESANMTETKDQKLQLSSPLPRNETENVENESSASESSLKRSSIPISTPDMSDTTSTPEFNNEQLEGIQISEDELKKYLQPDDIGRNRSYDNLNHDNKTLCTRNCTLYPSARICYYIFNIEVYHAMGFACKNCSKGNVTHCYGAQCIAADGIERQVHSINRQIPGPAIDVCYGDRIIVDVVNKMPSESITIHWHGLYQKDTPWMDGVPFVTQCPIQPNSKFRYDFKALTNGTLFYHSHMGPTHSNGVFGSLTVRLPGLQEDSCYGRYEGPCQEYDLPSHNIIIADWKYLPFSIHTPGYLNLQIKEDALWQKPDTYLINGFGRYRGGRLPKSETPLARFFVESGKKYRFRIIASSTSTCAFKFAIERHVMQVVAVDGFPCKPVYVETLVMAGGQRTDVVIDTSDKPDMHNSTYWILVEGMRPCHASKEAAYLIYDSTVNDPNKSDPPTSIRSLSTYSRDDLDEPVFRYFNNYEFLCDSDNNDNICSDSLFRPQTSSSKAYEELLKQHVDVTINLDLTNIKLSPENMTDGYNPFHVPSGADIGAWVNTINNVSGIFPPVPLLTQRNEIPADFEICKPDCKKKAHFRRCLCLIEIPLNSVVDINFDNGALGRNGSLPPNLHPIHIHGHHFTVIPVEKKNTQTGNEFERGSTVNRDMEKVQRDTVFVPLDGRAKIRFTANNPGYWIMHCHYIMHMEGGMFIVFQVGNETEIPKPPNDFPKCGNYAPPIGRL